jgi:hypothetical protein
MTSYSIYYPTEPGAEVDADELRDNRLETFLAGAARNVLDTARLEITKCDPVSSDAEQWSAALASVVTPDYLSNVMRNDAGQIRVVDPNRGGFGWATVNYVEWDSDGIENRYANATDWHSADKGWEIDGIHPDERDKFRERLTAFFDANYEQLQALADLIVANKYEKFWNTSHGYAWYRIGILYVYTAQGAGISFLDHGDVGRALHDAMEAAKTGNLQALAFDSYDDSRNRYVSFEEI